MCCITLIAPTITMATTQFTRESWLETCCAPAREQNVNALRMNWVVVTDEKQNCRMRLQWTPSAD